MELTPRVYVEEVASVPPAITAVDPSVVAIVGPAATGPLDVPVALASVAQAGEVFGAGSWLAVAVADHLTSGGLSVLAVRCSSVTSGLAALVGRGVRLLVVESGAAEACAWCSEHRAFLVTEAAEGGFLPVGLGRDAAAYHPPLLSADGSTRSCAPAVSGVMVRTDRERGVWRPPSGTAAEVPFPLALSPVDPALLAARGVNALRVLGGRAVVWGARTAAWQDPEWRYVNVRRTVVVLEESLDRGLQWVVFEPNGEALWSQARSCVGQFLDTWWRRGALCGDKVGEAFFVKCDRTTMTDDDVAAGRLVLLVGVALLRPAEFVLLRVVQTTRGT